ncbi:MAG TPA: class I SAM-dependent methyltransferase [Woeseiaceae bacterium]|nr:class I SAM-dependent methyltransferase [Woeseiaceae bacterium]
MPTQAAAKDDPSNGYEAIAAEFMRRRGESNIGAATVRRWSRGLPPGATILDLGCGHGIPLAMALIEDGFNVYGVDASPTLIVAFRSRFPHAHVTCDAVEASDFFGRTFDGVLAIGLIFLLDAGTQRELIRKVAQALTPGGRFLFTAPRAACNWTDVLTGRPSLSLGAEGYEAILTGAGLAVLDEYLDEGENHYFDALK